jgi:acyl-[acyl-carrier-protein]-phospholipid O-acyltransferase/long-chain-fatty-acid--[acyl-carrier-protein] ligase
MVRYGNDASLAAMLTAIWSLSFAASIFMSRTGEPSPDLVVRRNIIVSTFKVLAHLHDDRRVAWGAWVTCWFWSAGAVVLAIVPLLVKTVLGGSEIAVTLCLAVFSVGVAIGSALAALVAKGRIVLHPIVVAALLIGVFSLALGLGTSGLATHPVMTATESSWSGPGLLFLLALAGLSISGGLFIVPAMAAIQHWAQADRRARVIAAVSILNAGSMTIATLGASQLLSLGVTAPEILILMGACGLAIAACIACTLPAVDTEGS